MFGSRTRPPLQTPLSRSRYSHRYKEFREKYLVPIKNFIREKFQSLVKKASKNQYLRKIVPNSVLESSNIELNEEEKLKEAQRQKQKEMRNLFNKLKDRQNQAMIEAQTAIPSQKDPSLSILEQSKIDMEVKQKEQTL